MPARLCKHIFENDHRCGSPAMRGENHCFYHHPTRKPALTRRTRAAFTLPPLTSPNAHQQALAQIIHGLAANRIDVHRASLLLRALQLAKDHY
jgi:hypothetical protein